MGVLTPERVRQILPNGWLPLSHAEAIQQTQGLELIALCDISQESLVRAGKMYDVEALFADYRELVMQARPDILSIATRTSGRADIVEFAADNGVRGIHAEKPLSLNMAECKRALNAVEVNGAKLTYGTLRRFMPVYQRAREMVSSGEIGELVEIRIEHGKTTLLWGHPHSVDLLLFFSGSKDVEYVQGVCEISEDFIHKNIVDCDPIVENAFVKFKNGVHGVLTCGSGMNTCLSGTKGKLAVVADGSHIEVNKPTPEGYSGYYHNVNRIRTDPEMSGTERVFHELRDSVRGEGQISISTDEIAIGQSILFALVFSSLQGGRRLGLTELPDELTVTGRIGSLLA